MHSKSETVPGILCYERTPEPEHRGLDFWVFPPNSSWGSGLRDTQVNLQTWPPFLCKIQQQFLNHQISDISDFKAAPSAEAANRTQPNSACLIKTSFGQQLFLAKFSLIDTSWISPCGQGWRGGAHWHCRAAIRVWEGWGSFIPIFPWKPSHHNGIICIFSSVLVPLSLAPQRQHKG